MALKGKKKKRGSQARRRPAGAPRQTYTPAGREKPRWYQTTQGLVIAGAIGIVLVIVGLWWVSQSRQKAQERADERKAVETFTDDVEALTEQLSKPATGIAGAASLDDEELAKQAQEWKADLTSAQTALSQSLPPEGLDPVGGLLSQALLLYGQSVEQYELLPELEGNVRDQLSGKAAGSFQAANNIIASAIQLIDAERDELGLDASGLTAPAAGPPPEMGTTEDQGDE